MNTLHDIILDSATVEELKHSLPPERFTKVVTFYLEDSLLYFQQVCQGLDANELPGVIRASHTLKSLSAQIGAHKLALLAKNVELQVRAAHQNNRPAPDMRDSLPELEDTLHTTRATLALYIENH